METVAVFIASRPAMVSSCKDREIRGRAQRKEGGRDNKENWALVSRPIPFQAIDSSLPL